jgi:hypothetical protein
MRHAIPLTTHSSAILIPHHLLIHVHNNIRTPILPHRASSFPTKCSYPTISSAIRTSPPRHTQTLPIPQRHLILHVPQLLPIPPISQFNSDSENVRPRRLDPAVLHRAPRRNRMDQKRALHGIHGTPAHARRREASLGHGVASCWKRKID